MFQKDTLRDIGTRRNNDIVVLVSSDCGYIKNISELRRKGKYVIVSEPTILLHCLNFSLTDSVKRRR